jgi:hypothetical protein
VKTLRPVQPYQLLTPRYPLYPTSARVNTCVGGEHTVCNPRHGWGGDVGFQVSTRSPPAEGAVDHMSTLHAIPAFHPRHEMYRVSTTLELSERTHLRSLIFIQITLALTFSNIMRGSDLLVACTDPCGEATRPHDRGRVTQCSNSCSQNWHEQPLQALYLA